MKIQILKLCFIVCIILGAQSTMSANGNGRTGSASAGCNNGGWFCHGNSTGNTVVTVTPQYITNIVAPGEARQFTAVVAHPTQSKAGINVDIRNASGAIVGTMAAGTGTQDTSGEITHNGKQDIVNGQCTFTFTWTAPNSPGTYTLRAAGNAVNNNNNQSGDFWTTMTPMDITVSNPILQEPTSGAKLCRGEIAIVRWSQPMYDGNVRLEVSTNGINWTTIATTPGSPNFYQWLVPADFPIATTYRMRISHATKGTQYNTTSYQFAVVPSPVFVSQPAEVRTCRGRSVTFSVTTDFPSNYTFQWRHNFNPINGATSTSYTIPSVNDQNAGNYDVVVTGCRPVPSNNALLLLLDAPYFIKHPENTDGCPGQPTQLSVSVRGESPQLQWRFRGVPLPGKTDSILTIPSLSPADTGLYDVVATGTCAPPGTSLPARISFTRPSVITSQTKDTLICLDRELVLGVQATGRNLTYRWKHNNVLVAENASATYTILNVGLPSAGTYTVDVITACGAVTSAKPMVVAIKMPVAITKQPKDTTVRENGNLTLSVKATGDSPTYEWYKVTTKIPGATTNTLTVNNVKKSDAGKYSCVVSSSCGSQQSTIVNVKVTEAPAGPLLSLNTAALDYGCITVGAAPLQKVITKAVTNTGGQPLVISSIAPSQNDEKSFTVSPKSITLAPGQSTDITITFTATERKDYTTQIVFTSNSIEQAGAITLNAKGCIAQLSSVAMAFDIPITLGTSQDTVIQFSNTGDYDIIVNTISLKGNAANDYSMTAPILPDTLAKTETMAIPLRFAPSAEGIRSALMEIMTDKGIYTAALTGEGKQISSVRELAEAAGIAMMPNPSLDGAFTIMSTTTPLLRIQVTDMLGILLWDSGTYTEPKTKVQCALNNPSSGQYTVIIHTMTGLIALPIQIQK